MGNLNYTTARVNELLKKANDMPDSVTDGKTPVLETGTTTTLSSTESATSEVVRSGEDVNGNPRYKINLGIPKGRDGTGGSGGGTAGSVDWTNVQNKPSWVNSSTKPSYTASEVGALPSGTIIPDKTSQLNNDSKFVRETGLRTVNGQSLVGSGNITISGGSGGGGGNVSVTNVDSLVKGRLYAFNPSANGSADGTFSTIPEASSGEAGLMGTDLYDKLWKYKDVHAFPATVLSLTAASTSDDILTAFGFDPVNENLGLAYIATALASVRSSNYARDTPKVFIGNHECGVYASQELTTYTLELSYMDQGGALKIVKVTGKKGSDDTVTYSIGFSEGGGSEVYLPRSIFDLTASSTHEEVAAILDSLGGIEHIIGLAQKGTTKFYIVNSSSTVSNIHSSASLGGYIIGNILYYLDITYVDTSLVSHSINISGIKSGYNVKTKRDVDLRYAVGYYPVKSEVYALTSSSTSDEIKSAFYSASEFKRTIEAVKNGAVLRTSIPGSIGVDYTNPVYLNAFAAYVTNEGDATLGYTIAGAGINGYVGMQFVLISYMTSSDSFSIAVMPLAIGG